MLQSKISSQKLGFLAACCMFCSLIEFAIPKPVPFLRLGLSNLPLLLALFLQFGFADYLILILIKMFSQAWISGSLFSYVFVLSFTASVSGGLAMYLLNKKRKWFSFVGISVVGAFTSNLFQILVATIFMGEKILLLFPIMEAFGLVSSFILGLIANYYVVHSKFLEEFNSVELAEKKDLNGPNVGNEAKSVRTVGWISLIIMIFLFLTNNVFIVVGIFMYSLICNIILKKRIRVLNIIIFIFSITLISLFAPFGKVLLNIGSLKVTEGALSVGFTRAVKLQSTFFLSRLLLGFFNSILKKKSASFYLGRLIGYQFYYFSEINEKWNMKKVEGKKIRAYIDRVDTVLKDSLLS
ncbi:MAG: Gx transporter family protein [Sphaerochaetaceae bacterium]